MLCYKHAASCCVFLQLHWLLLRACIDTAGSSSSALCVMVMYIYSCMLCYGLCIRGLCLLGLSHVGSTAQVENTSTDACGSACLCWFADASVLGACDCTFDIQVIMLCMVLASLLNQGRAGALKRRVHPSSLLLSAGHHASVGYSNSNYCCADNCAVMTAAQIQ
jgi:hypothetical protein